jgi:hypothetical protein
MAQIVKKFIGDNQVADEKIRLDNNEYLRGRNAANSADVNMWRVNASDLVEAAGDVDMAGNQIVDVGAPADPNDAATKDYVDTAVAAVDTPIGEKETFTLIAGDITNQYIDLANVAMTDTIMFVVSGLIQSEGSDYTVNYTGGAGGNTRLTFAGDLATGGNAALVAGDVVRIQYLY